MNDAEYIQMQQQLLCLAAIIKDMPIGAFLRRISLCETVAPLIAPSLFIEGIDRLTLIKEIAKGAQSFQNVVIWCSCKSKG